MSNSTQNSATAKTKSAPKLGRTFKTVLVCVAVAALLAPFVSLRPNGVRLASGGQTYYLEKATSQTAMEKGLSNRTGMAKNRGMLFVFDTPAKECFWMKDMQFPLDIIWLDSHKTVTYVKANVSPRTYPAEYCVAATKYVVELNAGEAALAGITPGKTLSF